MKPVCVPCRRFFRMKKTGFYFIEGMPKPIFDNAGQLIHRNPMPGNIEPQHWKPYKVWAGDLWECPDCGAQIVSGVGHSALSEHYQDNFIDTVKSLKVELQVNDC